MGQSYGGVTGQSGGGGRGSEVAQQAKQQGQQLTQQAREQAGQLANRGGEQVKSQLENQKHEAAQRLMPVQTALRETAQQLRKQGQDPMGRYADKAADGVEGFSSYLRETDVDEMTDEVRTFARSRPAVFLGAAAALGFVATRFLKSSSQEANGSRSANDAAAPHRTGATALPPSTAGSNAETASGSTATVERTPVAGQSSGGRSGSSRGI